MEEKRKRERKSESESEREGERRGILTEAFRAVSESAHYHFNLMPSKGGGAAVAGIHHSV